MKKLIVSILSLLFLIELQGQVVSISNVDFFLQNKKMQIRFEIDRINTNPDYSYSFCIKVIKKNSLEIINPKNISGDISNVSSNGSKTIDWDILKDVKYLDGEFIVEVYVCDQKPIIKSTIYNQPEIKYTPNAVQPNFQNKQQGSLSSPFFMLLLGGGSKLYSNSLYKKYESSTNQVDIDKFYNSANVFNKAAVVSTGVGVIWAIIKLSSPNKNKSLSMKNDGFNSIGFSYTLNDKK
jgi:hypothetical protein